MEPSSGQSESSFLAKFWALAKPYWTSEHKWKARGLLAIVVSLTLGNVYILMQYNTWNKLFYDALQKFEQNRLIPLIVRFGLIMLAMTLVSVYQLYFTQLLEIRWREWMTTHMIDRWLSARAFYFLQLAEKSTDNPDQRVAEDIQAFVHDSLSLSMGVLNKTVVLFMFLGILWGLSGRLPVHFAGFDFSIPGYMAFAALLYAIFGSVITHKIGKRLTPLNFTQQRYEADFRFGLVRLRENTESIALSGGERAESRALHDSFTRIIENFHQLMLKRKQLGFFTNIFAWCSPIFPMVLAAPRYFAKAIELGGFMQIVNAYNQVEGALRWPVDNYVDLTRWAAVVQRLAGFSESLDRMAGLEQRAACMLANADGDEKIILRSVSLSLPSARPLLQELNLELSPGRSVLLHGPSGCGKSVLLRALSGAWPYAEGRITLPRNAKFFVVPQKSYMPVASLREALTYPHMPKDADSAELRELMQLCRLEHLFARLDDIENWAQILSPGEQQRIAFVRVFLHKPEWIFLDESTSAIDEDMQATLYRALRQKLPSAAIVSIAHRTSLHEFHDRHFDVVRGLWSEASRP